MPVIITDYTWRQTAEEIIISVPIKGSPKNIDVFAIDNYLKISYPPFILELFLWKNIIEEESQCILSESLATLTLKKCEIEEEWPSLIEDNLSKEKKHEYRSRALEHARLAAEKREEDKKRKYRDLGRQAVREQIELDSKVLNKINATRDSHRREAMDEFENWRKNSEKKIFCDEKAVEQENRKSYKAPLKWFKSESDDSRSTESQSLQAIEIDNKETDKKSTSVNEEKNSLDNERSSSPIKQLDKQNRILDTSYKEREADSKRGKEIIDKLLTGKYRINKKNNIFDKSDVSIPAPRESGKVTVTFSERVFPTPARESYYLEEQEWLEKQAEARRKCGFISEDLRVEEQDPQWLKDKGDEFFKVGNYLAAISAYTHGIKLSDKMSSLYANRAAAQYALGNYQRCAEDCSKALELMEPKCEGNRESRARCHARFGAALCKLSAPQHGIPELEAALKLAPDNETIKRDLEAARKFFQLAN
ncbi:dynein axonemal assembly factor 4-like [Microplitis mediator]|uniref:dynein axonemal assembly factor 4-like n=1 Tax=Microplitis mediator TaxID=375433 RepID=UPI002554DD2F|nr:dynein axonemal assembly factor 4-like [Microplitis mediator]